MAYANKRRVSVAIEPETQDTILKLSGLMNTSFAKVAGSFLDDAQPQLQALVDALKDSKSGISSAATLQLALIEAQRKALQAQEEFLRALEKTNPQGGNLGGSFEARLETVRAPSRQGHNHDSSTFRGRFGGLSRDYCEILLRFGRERLKSYPSASLPSSI